jgi:hypothetical protein
MQQARFHQHQEKMSSHASANPQIMAPIEGVTMEQYAELNAKAATGMQQQQFLGLLAQAGMDYPKWERVSAGWLGRMSQDTTGTLATIYGKAFSGAGAGKYGTAGAAAAQVGYGGGAAAGPEPIPFEKLCEIQGAMSAWGKNGQDVNAGLQQSFQMSALDWSNVSTWWMTKMIADTSLLARYNDLSKQYEARYAGAQPRRNQDLRF